MPIDVHSLLQSYFEIFTDSVLEHGGVFDSYSGDSCMAWWESAENACICAKDIVKRVESMNSTFDRNDLPKMRVGIGINSGMVALGNYGSPQRMKYSVLGDNVNLAANLLNMAIGEYLVPIVISESTKRLIPATFETRLLEAVHVKGREEPVEIFSL
jgi:adenylate cyclase